MQISVGLSVTILSEEAHTGTNQVKDCHDRGFLTLLSRRRDPRQLEAVSSIDSPVKATMGIVSRDVYEHEVTS